MAKSFFKGTLHSNLYAKYRPCYSEEIFNLILEFCEKVAGKRQLAVDVACGTGNSTVPLSKFFKAIIGVDASETQIKTATLQDLPNVSYRQGEVENMPFLEIESVDLITCAQALHWLDLTAFYREVDRILKPGGAFVAYGYNNVTLDKPEACQLTNKNSHFYRSVLGPHWTSDRLHVEDSYQRLQPPYPNYTRNDSMTIHKEVTVEELIGYFSSFSAYQKYKRLQPDETEMESLYNRLKKIYKEDKVTATWPVFMLFSRKPSVKSSEDRYS